MAERAEAESSRRSGFERGRQAVGWLTAAMVVVAMVMAVAGMELAAAYRERESSMALISSGGPTVVASEAPSTPSGAGDVGVTFSASSGAVEERGRWALEQISYPWPEKLPGWTIEFDDGRDGLFGLTLVDDKRIEIYVRDDQSADLLVHIVAHELGHAVDVTLNDGGERRAWQRIRGIEDEPWWPSSAASDFSTGAGDFAESFAYWQTESDNFRSKLGPPPTPAQVELMAQLAAD